MADHSSSNKRLARNSLVLYLRMLITMVIKFFTLRLVLQALGAEDFGIYGVVGGVVLLFDSINASLSNANARFIAIEVGVGTQSSLNRLYSCIITIHYLFGLIIFVLAETAGLWFVMSKLVIPETRMTAAIWVYQSSVISSIITIISSPYTGLLIAHEKMSAFAVISVFDSFAKLSIALFLFISPFDRLIVYAIMVVIIHLIVRIIYTIYCRRKLKESRYKILWDKNISQKVLSFAGWTLTGNVALMGSSQGLNILFNMFFGAILNAARGIAVQVQGASRMFVYCFQTAINPQIIKSYSQNDLPRMHKLIIISSRFSYYLMLLIFIPFCMHTENILSLWLGKFPDYTSEFVQIMLAVALTNTLQNPTMVAIHATGNIRSVQIVESFLLISVVPIAYCCLRWLHISPLMVFRIYFFIEFLTQFVRVILIYPKIHIPIVYYISKIFIPIVLVTAVSYGFCCLLGHFFEVNGFWKLVLATLSYVLVIFSTIMVIGLNNDERQLIYNFINLRLLSKH